MADRSPANASFDLPQNADVLARMRDQLSDYLGTLERNTDRVNEWLDDNRAGIIVAHHRLVRAIVQDKDATSALRLLNDMGNTAGFVLSLQDFGALAAKAFGQGTPDEQIIAKIIKATPTGLPEKILEKLPELRAPSAEDMAAPNMDSAKPSQEELDAARGTWWNPTSWFGKSPAQLQADAEAESARKIAEIKRHWGLVKTELVSLQSERHYYVDSFMDWIADTMEPEGAPKNETDLAREMLAYQNPKYVIDLAHEDYGRVIHGKALALRAQALDYSKQAGLIDTQDIQGFIATLPALFPAHDTQETLLSKALLLKDFGVASFAELALEKVKSRADQLDLLQAALRLEPAFTLSTAATPADVFARVVKETTAADQLDSRALALTLAKLKAADGYKENMLADIAGVTGAGQTVFERLANRFDADMPMLEKAMDDLIEGMNGAQASKKFPFPSVPFGRDFVQFLTAQRTQDAPLMQSLLVSIAKNDSGRSFKAFLDLTQPQASIVAALEKTAPDAKTLATLMDMALDAGLLDEFRFNVDAAHGNRAAFANFFVKNILAEQAQFPLPTVRRLIAHTYANGGLDSLRQSLVDADGWLQQTVENDGLAPTQKTAWMAALLEPFAADIVKSNILFEAAQNASKTQAAKILSSVEENFSGSAVRLADDKLMTNIESIANIWYSADAGVMHYTVNGTDHVFMESLSPVLAKDVLTHIQRKGGFLAEYDGLFRPENIDRITTDAQGSKVAWNRHGGNLNVEGAALDALHARADFAHCREDGGRVQSVNQKSIALLQPLEDGSWLLVDRYGTVQFLEGVITIKPQPPLLDLGGAYFNPENASVISLNAEKNRIDFRLESRDFDALLDRAAPGEYFYGVDLPSSLSMADVEQSLKASDGLKQASGNALSPMYFNVKALGYMMFAGGADAGFSCHKHGTGKKPGFINTEEDMAQDIFAALAQQDGIIAVANLLAHKDAIDDAYYNADKGRFFMVANGDLLQTDCTADEAYAALKKISQEAGFKVVGANAGTDGKGTAIELPADVVNLNNATLIFASPAQERTFVVCANEKFHVNLDGAQAESLMDDMVQENLVPARVATPKNLQWTQNLKSALLSLPRISVSLPSVLTQTDKRDLLETALGRGKEQTALPAAQADFSIAAQAGFNTAATAPVKLKTGNAMTYPPRRPRAPKLG